MKKQIIITIISMLGVAIASADVAYTDYSADPLTYEMGTSGTGSLFVLELPGVAKLEGYSTTDRGLNFFQTFAGAGVVDFGRHLNGSFYYFNSAAEGETWSSGSAVSIGGWGNIASISQTTGEVLDPRADPTYILFRFEDTTDGNMQKYGYYKTSTEVSGSGVDSVLIWKIYGYGYETEAGTEIAMGAVPEPATMGLLGVVGAGILFFRRRFMS